ncbi:MAG: hypothetical protein HQK79_22500 [Desulfobacterales bacterium]|nr:hypothetical protein [Desulfobacterales bacterium]
MCGYCIESNYTIPAIESVCLGGGTMQNHNVDPLYLPNFLQEEQNLLLAVEKVKEIYAFDGYLHIVLCRLFEENILHGHYEERFDKVVSTIGYAQFFEFLEKCLLLLGKYKIGDKWERIYHQDIYQDMQRWNSFILNQSELIDEAINLLNYYYDWWIKGYNKMESDPNKRMAETGIMDPIDNTPLDEGEKFYTIFPLIYTSLIYVWKYGNGTDFIKKIAVNNPKWCPSFFGYDLWLQRKAFYLYVEKVGLLHALKLTNKIKIRFEPVYYALLKHKINKNDNDLIEVMEILNKNSNMFYSDGRFIKDDVSKIIRFMLDTINHSSGQKIKISLTD